VGKGRFFAAASGRWVNAWLIAAHAGRDHEAGTVKTYTNIEQEQEKERKVLRYLLVLLVWELRHKSTNGAPAWLRTYPWSLADLLAVDWGGESG
jgi:hypothetical protein